MKRILLLLVLSNGLLSSSAQSPEERETKLLMLLNSYSTGFLYNTYGLIGSIGDGYEAEAYSVSQAEDLLQAQEKLAANLSAQLEKMITEGAFMQEKDRLHMVSVTKILRGLGAQAGLLSKLVNNKNRKTTEAYEQQRGQNWKDLSKLMGIKE